MGISDKRKKYMTAFDQRAPIVYEPVQREICKRIARGDTLTAICADPDLPSKEEIYDLIWREPEFGKMYRQARMARADVWFEEMHELAEEASKLEGVPEKKANAHVQAIRVRLEQERWALSKLNPAQYGDDMNVNPAGKAVEGMLEIIKMVSGLAKDPVKATVIDVPLLEDKA